MVGGAPAVERSVRCANRLAEWASRLRNSIEGESESKRGAIEGWVAPG